MTEISIIIVASDADDYIVESVESVLDQSFPDFELIVVVLHSSDSVRSAITSCEDKRVRLMEGGTDYVESLNLGLQSATGKYVVHMQADDLMHIDRLKINHSTMKESPEITACGSWTYIFGEKMNRRISDETVAGLIECPALRMLLNETVFEHGPMIRKSFITEHGLVYRNYVHAEDFKLSADIANLGGTFYMESQPLQYRRMDDTKILRKHRLQKLQYVAKIKREILDSVCDKNKSYPAFASLCDSYFELAAQGFISQSDMFRIIHSHIAGNTDIFKL